MLRRCSVVLLVIVAVIGIAQASPLEISVIEKVNSTAIPSVSNDGSVTYSYSTNVKGFVNITNKGNEVLYDVWVALNLTNTTGTCSLLTKTATSDVYIYSDAGNVPDKINKTGVFNTSDANCFVHIPVLKPNEYAVIQYDVDDSAMGIDSGAPFIIDEKYDPAKIPAKAPYTWKVLMNVTLNETWFSKTALDLSGKTVTVTLIKYLSNQTANFGSDDWKVLYTYDSGTYAPSVQNGGGSVNVNVYAGNYTVSGNKDTIVFSNIQLSTTTKYVNTTFYVTGNYTNSTASPFHTAPFGFAVLSFNVNGNVSGSHLVDVFAMGNATINVTKYGPNATNYWFGNATVKNTASGLTYVLTNVTMWATSTGSFTNTIAGPREWTPNVVLNPGDAWNTSQGNPAGISFKYNGVPVIWANATFKLIEDQNNGWWFKGSETLNGTNSTYGSGMIVLEKVYVIGTYLIKVTKHVIWNDTANAWDVYIVVENVGGERSPSVWVYDLIPENFSLVNGDGDWTTLNDADWVNKSSMLVSDGNTTNVPSDYSSGYWWQLNPLEPNSNGDGSYTDWSEIANNQSVVIHYQMSGSGEFHPTDAFVVGIDPMFSMDPQTAHKITIVSGAKADNYETLMAMATGIVGLIGMVVSRRR